MDTLVLALERVFPIFFMIIVGLVMRQTGLIGETFIKSASNIVFRVAMPVMVFQKMIQIRVIPSSLYLGLLIFIGVTFGVILLAWAGGFALKGPQRATFVQGAFRSNIAIIGLAVIEKSYGLKVLQVGAVLLAVVMPLYNLGAIILLSRGSVSGSSKIVSTVVQKVITNPLIWGVILGLPAGLLQLEIPSVVNSSFSYLSQLTLPLALIGIGGNLSLKGLNKNRWLWSIAGIIKLGILPFLILVTARGFGIDGAVLKAMVLTGASPTAVASFVMAHSLGGDGPLAGEIISITTLASIFTFSLWIMVLGVY